MTSPSARADRNIRRVPPGADGTAATKRLLRYQLDVVAASAADAVQYAGGWLFDRAMAGWTVNVLLADQHPADDPHPLQILGVRTAELRTSLASLLSRPERAAGLAVSADLLASDGFDDDVYQCTAATLCTGLTEVALWGAGWPDRLTGPGQRVEYRLSAAAKAFKGRALAAAGLPAVPVGPTETLFRGGYRPLDSDLIPVD